MEANRAIGCSVSECRFHAKSEPLCSLNQIKVAKKVNDVAKSERDTECASFEKE